MTDFYSVTGAPSTGSSGSSAVIRGEFTAIAAAFAKLAGYTGNGGLPLFVNAGGTAHEAANIATAQNRLGIVSSNELNGLANLNAVGVIARTGNGAFSSRTITGTANQITVANGNGASANPTLSIADPFNVGNISSNGRITGSATGAANAASIVANAASTPGYGWSEAGQGANNKLWDMLAQSGKLVLRVVDDAVLVGNNIMTVTRNGVNITGIAFGAPINSTQFLTPLNNSLAADVPLNNTAYVDGPSVAQGNVGTWFASGTVSFGGSTGIPARYAVKLYDGTTVIASCDRTPIAANERMSATLSGFITSPSGNIRMAVTQAAGALGNIFFNVTGLGKDSTITAIRIG